MKTENKLVPWSVLFADDDEDEDEEIDQGGKGSADGEKTPGAIVQEIIRRYLAEADAVNFTPEFTLDRPNTYSFNAPMMYLPDSALLARSLAR